MGEEYEQQFIEGKIWIANKLTKGVKSLKLQGKGKLKYQ